MFGVLGEAGWHGKQDMLITKRSKTKEGDLLNSFDAHTKLNVRM